MENKPYEVELVYRQVVRYRVEAADREAAERLAIEMWRNEDEGLLLGHECCELVSITAAEAQDPDRSAQDCEVALRFLRDRELVIETLDDDIFNPTVHDAVSAEEVARHLEWTTTGPDGAPVADVARAMRALEELCRQQRVVCFSRPRLRRGERGEIRLYCTPQHLEQLAGMLDLLEPQDAEPAAGEEEEHPEEAGIESR